MRKGTLIPVVLGAAVVGATLVGAGPAAAAQAGGGTCEKHGWINQVQGRPVGLSPHSKRGDYFWHNSDGFHLRVTQRRNVAHTYSGTITATAPIVGFKWVRLEKQDTVSLSSDKLTITFSFVNHGWIDGFDFRTACADSLTVADLKIDGKALSTSKVYLGKHRAHPAGIPFTVHRKA